MSSTYLRQTPNVHIHQLETFRSVYQLGGYAAAAAESDLSVPTIWQHIQAVERAYGVRLFEKVGRRVEPTAAARKLHDALDSILVGLQSTYELMQSSDQQPAELTVVAGNRMMLEDLAQPLHSFRKKQGDRLAIHQGNNKRAEEMIIADEADLGLSLEPTPDRASSKIHYEPAYIVDFLAVCPKRHLYAKSSGSLKELVRHPLVVTAPGTHGRQALEQALYRERLEADIVVETDNSGFTIACVQAGMGLGILAGRPDGKLCQKLAVRSLRKQLGRRQIVFMWRKGRHLSESLLALIEAVHSYYSSANS